MKRIFFILFLVACFSCKKTDVVRINATTESNAQIDTSILPIVVLAGQSNMEGGDKLGTNPAPFTGVVNNTLVFYKPTNTNVNNGRVQTLKFAVNNNWRTPKERYGPEMGIGKYMADTFHKKIGIIKYAYAASMLVDHGLFANGHWQIDAVHNTTLKHYAKLVKNFIMPGLDSFRAKGYKPYIVALAWCQGETDAGDSISASRYKVELTRLINQFRTDIPEAANAKFIVTRTRSKTAKWLSVGRKAQEDVADYLIDADSWDLISDQTHFTRLDQATKHGKGIAEIVNTLIQ